MQYLYVFLMIISFNLSASDWVWGTVVYDSYECEGDRIVIETKLGFTLAEVYSGYHYTNEGTQIIGDLHSYGFTGFNTNTSKKQTSGRIYIDDYMVDEYSALQWCSGN